MENKTDIRNTHPKIMAVLREGALLPYCRKDGDLCSNNNGVAEYTITNDKIIGKYILYPGGCNNCPRNKNG